MLFILGHVMVFVIGGNSYFRFKNKGNYWKSAAWLAVTSATEECWEEIQDTGGGGVIDLQ